MNNRQLNSSNWANDLDNNMITNGENVDIDTINQSLENIITTSPGERLFNLFFGCYLSSNLFENITPSFAEDILNEITAAIKKWETRVTLIESNMRLIRNIDDNSIIIVIPYKINNTNITSVFKKKVINF